MYNVKESQQWDLSEENAQTFFVVISHRIDAYYVDISSSSHWRYRM
jgi:hypothetical protein